jgi:hypothetical protein
VRWSSMRLCMGSSSRPWEPLVCRGVRPRRRSAANRFVGASERAEGLVCQRARRDRTNSAGRIARWSVGRRQRLLEVS